MLSTNNINLSVVDRNEIAWEVVLSKLENGIHLSQ